jgi:hypothetical protein
LLVVKPVLSKANSLAADFAAKCQQPRAQPLPLLETRQSQLTEFFKSNGRVGGSQEMLLSRMLVAEKVYKSDKISYYFRS